MHLQPSTYRWLVQYLSYCAVSIKGTSVSFWLADPNGSDEEPPPPKPARPQYPMSPTGSIPNLSSNISIGSVSNHWNSTSHLAPQGHSTPAGPSPNTDSLKRQAGMASIEEHRPPQSTTTTTNLFQGYFPSSAGYMQVRLLLLNRLV